jgi:hypothetical protein
VHATDRLWQMEQFRRAATRRAEPSCSASARSAPTASCARSAWRAPPSARSPELCARVPSADRRYTAGA